MNKLLKKGLTAILLFCSATIYSQKNNISRDNLLQSYFTHCEQMKNTSADSLCYFAHLARVMAYEKKNASDESVADYYCAYCTLLQGNIDSAGAMVKMDFAGLKDSTAHSTIYELLGQLGTNVLIRQEKYKDAVAASLRYLSFAESVKDTLFEIVFKNYVGVAHMKMLQKDEALAWYRNGLTTSSNTDYYCQFPVIYGNTGILFATMGKWDSAFYYAQRAIKYENESRNFSGLAGVLPAVGATYMETNRQRLAQAEFDESLSAARKLNDPYMTIAALIANATYYHASGDYKKSLSMCAETIDLIQRYNIPSQLSYTYRTFADDYKQLGDYKNYSKALEKDLLVEDSLYKRNSAEAIADLQVKYEVQKEQNTILKQQFELGRKNYWIYGGFVVAATILLFSIFLFRANRNRQKIKMQLMQKEQQFKEQQAVKDAEEKERSRVAAELHDDMGTRINILSHAASQLMEISPDLGTRIKETSDDLMQSLRETVWTLKQETIHSNDVWVRFKNFISKLRNAYSAISFDVVEEGASEKKLQYNEALHLIRILQEAAGNAVKHASCSQIICEKKISGASILFSVSDNGKGISPVGENAREGNGVPNMRARAKESGFNLTIHSTPGKGTRVEVRV